MTKTLLSANQTHPLHHTFFVPQGDVKASLLIVHGMSEHSGRYADVAQFLADNGVLVLTFDLLGHGKTVKDEDELGFFDEKYPVQTLSKDVMMMTDALNQKAKKLTTQAVPCFIMGHSMGSLLVRCVLTHHAPSFDGVILSGTTNGHFLDKISYPVLALLNYRLPKEPNYKLSNLFNHYLLSHLSCVVSPSSFAWLSEDTDNVQKFEQDPLSGFAFTNNGFFTLQRLMKKARHISWYAHLKSPILLLAGADDPVGKKGQDITDLQDELLRANKNVRAILYPNMRHEILQEKHASKVYADIAHWLTHQAM